MRASPGLAQRVLERIESKYSDQPIMAYTHELQAIPHEHFE